MTQPTASPHGRPYQLWSGNDSATWATTTPEDAGECVSERPLSGRFHQVRTPSVHGHFHQVRTPSVHGTIRPFRPRQRPSMQPTASPSARAHLLRTLKNYKVRICFGHKQNYKAHHLLPSSLPWQSLLFSCRINLASEIQRHHASVLHFRHQVQQHVCAPPRDMAIEMIMASLMS